MSTACGTGGGLRSRRMLRHTLWDAALPAGVSALNFMLLRCFVLVNGRGSDLGASSGATSTLARSTRDDALVAAPVC